MTLSKSKDTCTFLPGAKAFSPATLTVQLSPVKGCRQAQIKLVLAFIHVPPFWHGDLLQYEYSSVTEKELRQKILSSLLTKGYKLNDILKVL